jgi:uncharacterized protein
MSIELVCAALMLLLLVGLGLAVSVERGKAGKLGGTPDDETSRLFRLMRAHGNAAEYLPAGIAVALFAAGGDGTPILTWLLVAFTTLRFVHAFALIFGQSMNSFSVPRFIGGMGTYVTGGAIAVYLLVSAI